MSWREEIIPEASLKRIAELWDQGCWGYRSIAYQVNQEYLPKTPNSGVWQDEDIKLVLMRLGRGYPHAYATFNAENETFRPVILFPLDLDVLSH
jgi:hypothetical protein